MLTDEINNQIKTGRATIERSFAEVPKQVDIKQVRRGGLIAAGLVVVAVACGVGWMVYRNRRRQTLIERLHSALPEGVRDLPEGLRAQMKRPLERAAKAF